MIPGSMSADGQDTAVFNQTAQPFIDAGINVLQLGKPGVDFFTDWNNRFYDVEMVQSLTWQNLIDNGKDALGFLRQQISVDIERIYILGHSEGTQLATDLAKSNPDLKGLILLGYSARSLEETFRWQITERAVDYFVVPDVDANGDGFVSREEADAWTEFSWQFTDGQDKVSIDEIRTFLANDQQAQTLVANLLASHYCQDGHCSRPPLYNETLSFAGDIYAFTGELDLQTVAAEAQELGRRCEEAGRTNCLVEIIPGVQHSFNLPKGPRHHPLLDIAVAPVEPSFVERLGELAQSLVADK